MTWRPSASLSMLQMRSEMLWEIRDFFRQEHLTEVQTPVLSRDTVIDRHLDPIQVDAAELQAEGTGASATAASLYLQTSPEFGMKRIVAAGLTDIYQITPAFRAEEVGDLHNPEFTMLEWYLGGRDMQQGMEFLSRLTMRVTRAEEVSRTTYQQAFLATTGLDPLSASQQDLAEYAAARLSVTRTWTSDRDDWLDLLFAELVQPQLGNEHPTIISNYPASQSALAKLADDGLTAERYELFIKGVELANGYHELTDAAELARRNRSVNAQRRAAGKPALPEDSQLLRAMEAGLPPCTGCALGIDRLLLVVSGSNSLDEVMAFPVDRS